MDNGQVIMENEKLVPELRFPEFLDVWKNKRIENLFSVFKSGNNITAKNINSEGEYPVYGGNGLRGYTNTYTHDGFYLLIGRQGALCGNINRANGKVYISEHAIACKANDENNTEWMAQRLDYFKLNRLSESSAQPGLSVGKLLRFKLVVPTLKEQQKIANFLTGIDQRITQLKEKKAALEDYKKGLMQKIFSQEIRFNAQGCANTSVTGCEGEVSIKGRVNAAGAGSAGAAKHDEGNDFPDWEETKLGDIASLQMGTSPKSSAYNEERNGLPLIQGNADINNRQSSPRIYTSEITKECRPNDLLLSVRAPVGEIAKSRHHACIGRGVAAISAKTDTVIEYLYQYLLWYEPRWRSIAQGSTFESVNSKDIANLKLKIPSVEEQQKIANFLSTIDQKINAMDKQITDSELFKKGLLQRMFV